MKHKLRAGLGIAVLSALLATGISTPAAFAAGKDYPSWEDVQNAKGNESAKSQEIDRVKGLIDSLNETVASTREEANIAADAYTTAEQLATEATDRAAALAEEKAAAEKAASESQSQVGALLAQMARGGSSSSTLELLADPDAAENALYKLGAMSKLTTRSTEILDRAKQDANTVTSLDAQAVVAQDILAKAEAAAADALAAAEAAANTAQAAVDEQNANQERLIEQLASLQDTTKEVAAEYAVGVKVRAEEAARAAAAAAAAKAAAAKAAAEAAAQAARDKAAAEAGKGNSGGGSSSGGGSTGGGSTGGGSTGGGTNTGGGTYWAASSQGWFRPAPGAITSWYGYRPQLCAQGYCSIAGWHGGLDFGGYSGLPIKAVYGGTVVSVQNDGAFGNRVIIQHSNGVKSWYGHLSGYNTYVGQQVSAGQVIAYMGKTGMATGNHLDLKITVNGSPRDPAVFMRSKGVRI